MKYTFNFLTLLVVLLIISCTPKSTDAPAEDLADTTWLHDPVPDRWANPSETFTGNAQGVPVKFLHRDYTSYRLINGTDTIEGTLNTERGFQDDEDATLYILYYEYPDSVLSHFVRMTDGRVMMLDRERNVLKETEFRKE